MAETTRDRILDAALRAYGTEGFAVTSLDALADQLGIRKQTILYYFPSKHAVFEAVIDAAAIDLATAFEEEASRGLVGLEQVEAIVRRVFDLRSPNPSCWDWSGRSPGRDRCRRTGSPRRLRRFSTGLVIS